MGAWYCAAQRNLLLLNANQEKVPGKALQVILVATVHVQHSVIKWQIRADVERIMNFFSTPNRRHSLYWVENAQRDVRA